jgi:DNA-binding Xre family transcriptional regulator
MFVATGASIRVSRTATKVKGNLTMIVRGDNPCELEVLILENAERIRLEKQLTYQEMADRLGMHKVALGDIFRRKRRLSVKNVERLAKALEINPAVLLLPE